MFQVQYHILYTVQQVKLQQQQHFMKNSLTISEPFAYFSIEQHHVYIWSTQRDKHPFPYSSTKLPPTRPVNECYLLFSSPFPQKVALSSSAHSGPAWAKARSLVHAVSLSQMVPSSPTLNVACQLGCGHMNAWLAAHDEEHMTVWGLTSDLSTGPEHTGPVRLRP